MVLTITEGTMVGYIGRSVAVTLSVTVKLSVIVVASVIVTSGGEILIIAGGGRIGRSGKDGIFSKARDEVGSIGTVTMCSLLRTSQTNYCVNIGSRHRLPLVTGTEDRVNTTLTSCWSFQA